VSLLVERLVKTVARAFYSDNYIVVFDALLRERYIKESELAPRLRLKDKDIRAILSRLETKDLLVKHESLLTRDFDGKNRQHKFYYIDYQMFVDIVRYRIYLMQTKVDSYKGSTSDQSNNIQFECPTCKLSINILEATRSRSKDNKFICTKCCPYDDFRNKIAEIDYILISKGKAPSLLQNLTTLKQKLNDTMSISVYHESIYSLLKELSREKVGRNLPSDNMRLGFTNTQIIDDDTRQALHESLGKSVAQKKGRYLIENDIEKSNKNENHFEVELDNDNDNDNDNKKYNQNYNHNQTRGGIVNDDEDSDDGNGNNGPMKKKPKRATTVPEFLRRSGVEGANDVYKIESLNAAQSYRDCLNDADAAIDKNGNADGKGTVASLEVTSMAPQAQAQAGVTIEKTATTAAAEEGSEDDDDIDWED